MPWETKTLTREELYNLVWERPVQHVAERIGGTDVALGKTRRRLGIPVPGRGYWARKAAGAKLNQTPLPKLKPGQQHYFTLRRRVGREGKPSPPPKVTPFEVTFPGSSRILTQW